VNGCLKGIGRLGCAVMLLVVIALAWWYRAPLLHTMSRYLGPHSTRLPPVADTSVGAPTPAAVRSANDKLASLGRPDGPDSVVLTRNEMASLVGSGIDWNIRQAFDSLRVELLDGSFAVNARLDTRIVPRDALGPLQGMLAQREPLRIAGPLAIDKPGKARWTVREISLRGFPFPPAAVTALARKIAGAGPDGAVTLVVNSAVSRIAIHPTGVVCYRSSRP
jgi:hypothetical protein